MSESFDVVVIGSGPAGYVGAIRAAQSGLKVACVEKWTQTDDSGAQKISLGGTCLNVGCIPSKALLESSEKYSQLQHQFADHGITVENAQVDIATMLARKDGIVSNLTGGIGMLFKANKIASFHGAGQVQADKSVLVKNPETGETINTLQAKDIIIATGSIPVELPFLKFDHDRIVDSTGALNFKTVPEKLVIIGAGVIGLELGSVWRRLGAQVIVLEAATDFLATADKAVGREAARQFKKQGIEIQLGAKVTGAVNTGDKVTVTYEDKNGSQTIDADKLIVAVGRKPYTDGLFADGVDIKRNDRGCIDIDKHWRTSMANVYAVGDVVPGPMLAHKGSEEGIAAADIIAGKHGHVNFDAVPWVIYTHPEIAWVGKTEQELKQDGIEFKVGQFPFAAIGRARASGETDGFVKIIADKRTDKILGVHMVGQHVSELIAEAVLAVEYSASAEDLARTMHAHPTLSEAVHEAALAVDKRAIHKSN